MISVTLSEYFRFGQPYCCFRLSVDFEITVFEIAMVDLSGSQLKGNKFDIFLTKRLGFLPVKIPPHREG